jgi:gluconokinase
MRVAYQGEPPNNIPQGLWSYRIDEKRVVIGGALSDGGNLYEWCQRNFKLSAKVEDEIRRRDPGRALPMILPFFHGERSTGYREDAGGSILDLTASHDGADILHAAMIAVAEALARIRDPLKKLSPFTDIVASGRALRRSKLWREIISNTLDHELEVCDTDESALKGVVQLASESINGNG